MDPYEKWKQRNKQLAILARYGRRTDLLGPDVSIPDLNEALHMLNELLEDENPDPAHLEDR